MDQKTAGVQYKDISGFMKNTIIPRVEKKPVGMKY